MQKESPGDFNQALMEFGALQCTPKKPFALLVRLAQNVSPINKEK